MVKIQIELLEPQYQPIIQVHKQPKLSTLDHCHAKDLSEEIEFKTR